MCGIVGFISATGSEDKYPIAREHFMKYALIMDTLRGMDSTGLITVEGDFDVKAVKSTLPGDEFINHKLYKERAMDPWACIGHNRSATKGSVSVPNAHPFYYDKVCMVHNGTLDHNGSSLLTYDPKFAVDSMQIAYALSKANPEDAIKDVLENIEGSFAIVWTDERDKSVNMARNRDRPLHFTWNRLKDFMMFMSDGQMLNTINKSLGASDARGDVIYSIDSMAMLKFKKGQLEPEVTSFRPFTRPIAHYTGRGNGHRHTDAVDAANVIWSGRSSQVSCQAGGNKISINGVVQDIPKGHLEALSTFFHLLPRDRLMFVPQKSYHLTDKTLMVTGLVRVPLWGDAEWESVLMHVPLASYNAYRNQTWLIRPIGMSRMLESEMDNLPAVLGQLISPNGYNMAAHQEAHDARGRRGSSADVSGNVGSPVMNEGPIEEGTPLVKDDDGTLIQKAEYMKMLEDGCVNCLQPLFIQDIKDYVLVNNGLDVLCIDCQLGYKENG